MNRTLPRIDRKPAKRVRFARLGARRIALLVEAVTALAVARLIVVTRSPARVARGFGQPVAQGTDVLAGGRRAEEADRAADIGWAIRCAAANVPFRALCIEQALAARALLDRRAIAVTVHYGIAPASEDNGELRAHIWTDAAGEEVTGYPPRPAFREIARFSSSRREESICDGG
jgi:hypothetical protein